MRHSHLWGAQNLLVLRSSISSLDDPCDCGGWHGKYGHVPNTGQTVFICVRHAGKKCSVSASRLTKYHGEMILASFLVDDGLPEPVAEALTSYQHCVLHRVHPTMKRPHVLACAAIASSRIVCCPATFSRYTSCLRHMLCWQDYVVVHVIYVVDGGVEVLFLEEAKKCNRNVSQPIRTASRNKCQHFLWRIPFRPLW